MPGKAHKLSTLPVQPTVSIPNSRAQQLAGEAILGRGTLTMSIYTQRASPATDLLSATMPRSRILITRFASGALQDVTLVQTGSR